MQAIAWCRCQQGSPSRARKTVPRLLALGVRALSWFWAILTCMIVNRIFPTDTLLSFPYDDKAFALYDRNQADWHILYKGLFIPYLVTMVVVTAYYSLCRDCERSLRATAILVLNSLVAFLMLRAVEYC